MLINVFRLFCVLFFVVTTITAQEMSKDNPMPMGYSLKQEDMEKKTIKGFFSGLSYSLMSASFDNEKLKNKNQESLGLTFITGYSYIPESGIGVNVGVGILQNSKTENSLPDFLAFKPFTQIVFHLNQNFYVSTGIYTLKWNGADYKNYVSYIGSDYQIGYKVSSRLQLLFGYSYLKFLGEFTSEGKKQTSLVSLKAIESMMILRF
ncbi:MAG: hypothetical protein L6Q37_02685 [Bdellovibrionaceae bacterium]|nr:hypothetical protein [Pseudobdellovibrionaceae bacterium]NUM58034.1 hypothetical protein [Pseudobdellovibrionaceae bacterium]